MGEEIIIDNVIPQHLESLTAKLTEMGVAIEEQDDQMRIRPNDVLTGVDVIRIDGVEELHGCKHTIIPDRIEAGTYAIAAAAMGEEIIIDNVIPQHLESLTAKLTEMGVAIEEQDDQMRIRPNDVLTGVDV